MYSWLLTESVINKQLLMPRVVQGRRSFACDPARNMSVPDSQDKHQHPCGGELPSEQGKSANALLIPGSLLLFFVSFLVPISIHFSLGWRLGRFKVVLWTHAFPKAKNMDDVVISDGCLIRRYKGGASLAVKAELVCLACSLAWGSISNFITTAFVSGLSCLWDGLCDSVHHVAAVFCRHSVHAKCIFKLSLSLGGWIGARRNAEALLCSI